MRICKSSLIVAAFLLCIAQLNWSGCDNPLGWKWNLEQIHCRVGVHGTVIDSITSNPISEVHVYLYEREYHEIYGWGAWLLCNQAPTRTDTLGQYSCGYSRSGGCENLEFRLTFSKMGYHHKTVFDIPCHEEYGVAATVDVQLAPITP